MSWLKKHTGHIADPFTSAYNRIFDKGPSKVGSTLNDLTGSTDMLNREYANNVSLWNMQNEYNTPSAQIARMKAAGIDVNPMTYAVGNGNMSTTAGSVSAPSVGASGVNPISTLMSVMSGIETIRAQRLQNEMTEKDLQWYREHGIRPDSELSTLIIRAFDNIKKWWRNTDFFTVKPYDAKTPDEARSTDKLVVKDKSKPYIGSNVVRDKRSLKDIKFFPW